MEIKHPLPPFTRETAEQKVQMAEDAWNTKSPAKVALAYSVDTQWRNRSTFVSGRENVERFLTDKWEKEFSYKLKKTLWSFTDHRIAVTFFYEWHDANNQWYRSYGNELWEFNEQGLMVQRIASINDAKIEERERILK